MPLRIRDDCQGRDVQQDHLSLLPSRRALLRERGVSRHRHDPDRHRTLAPGRDDRARAAGAPCRRSSSATGTSAAATTCTRSTAAGGLAPLLRRHEPSRSGRAECRSQTRTRTRTAKPRWLTTRPRFSRSSACTSRTCRSRFRMPRRSSSSRPSRRSRFDRLRGGQQALADGVFEVTVTVTVTTRVGQGQGGLPDGGQGGGYLRVAQHPARSRWRWC